MADRPTAKLAKSAIGRGQFPMGFWLLILAVAFGRAAKLANGVTSEVNELIKARRIDQKIN